MYRVTYSVTVSKMSRLPVRSPNCPVVFYFSDRSILGYAPGPDRVSSKALHSKALHITYAHLDISYFPILILHN